MWDKDRVSSFELRLEPVRNNELETSGGGNFDRLREPCAR